MAQSGYTPILIYASGTTGNTPSAANLTSSSTGAELALNYYDGKLFYKDASGVVQVLASKAGNVNVASLSFGTTGLTPNTATTGAITVAGTLITSNGGTGLSSYTAGDLPYYASGTALSKLAIGTSGQILTSSGTAPQWSTLSGVAVTTFSGGTTGLTPSTATTGAITVAGTLNVANGGTGLTTLTAGYIPYGNGTSAFSSNANLTFNGTTLSTNTLNAVTFNINNGNNGTLSGQSYYAGFNQPIAELDFYNSASSLSNKNIAYIQGWIGSNNNVGVITFNTANGSNATEIARFTGAGYLGIGTSSPSYPLEVHGSNPTNGQVLRLRNDTGGGNGTQIAFDLNSVTAGAIGIPNNTNALAFYVNSDTTERMRIDSSGNLGLGVTPSAWSTNFKAIQLGNAGSLSAYTISGQPITLVQSNAIVGASSNTYITSAYAAQYAQNNGVHSWSTAPSGTAGNAISFTQAMTLDNSGQLGIGATSPTNTVDILTSDNLGLTVRSSNYSGSFSPSGLGGMALTTNGAYPLIFYINSAERARIDSSGNLLVGKTTSSGNGDGAQLFPTGTIGLGHTSGTVTATAYAAFGYAGGGIGSITQSGTTAVLYNVTSDQRLKTNIVDAPQGNIDSLKVRSFDWKSDNTHQTYGFIAQELLEVAPYAVHQPTNPEEMMGVDYSKLVPMMIKEIQDLKAEVNQLKQKLGV
jgi:hypothetical protein